MLFIYPTINNGILNSIQTIIMKIFSLSAWLRAIASGSLISSRNTSFIELGLYFSTSVFILKRIRVFFLSYNFLSIVGELSWFFRQSSHKRSLNALGRFPSTSRIWIHLRLPATSSMEHSYYRRDSRKFWCHMGHYKRLSSLLYIIK